MPGHDTSGQALDVTQARLLDSSAMEDGKGALALRGRDSQIDRDLALIERNLREEGLENKTPGQDGQDRGLAGTSARGPKKKAPGRTTVPVAPDEQQRQGAPEVESPHYKVANQKPVMG